MHFLKCKKIGVLVILMLPMIWKAEAYPESGVRPVETAFRVGQVWRYHTRPQEAKSTLIIFRIDSSPQGRVMHVRIVGLQVPNPHSRSGFNDVLPHAPFSEQALRQSVTELVGETKEFGNSVEAIRNWEKAQGGIWTIPVAEVIDTIAGVKR